MSSTNPRHRSAPVTPPVPTEELEAMLTRLRLPDTRAIRLHQQQYHACHHQQRYRNYNCRLPHGTLPNMPTNSGTSPHSSNNVDGFFFTSRFLRVFSG